MLSSKRGVQGGVVIAKRCCPFLRYSKDRGMHRSGAFPGTRRVVETTLQGASRGLDSTAGFLLGPFKRTPCVGLEPKGSYCGTEAVNICTSGGNQ